MKGMNLEKGTQRPSAMVTGEDQKRLHSLSAKER